LKLWALVSQLRRRRDGNILQRSVAHHRRGAVRYRFLCMLVSVNSKFEGLVIGVLVELYAAVLYNFSIMASAADVNNHGAFVRFRVLANALGHNQVDGVNIAASEAEIGAALNDSAKYIVINRISHGIVSFLALCRIVFAVLQ
jgi:hypothetical protein